jgi:hypothetical protein
MGTIKHTRSAPLANFLIIVVLLLSLSVESPLHAQSQKTWQWVKQLGGNSWDISAGVVSDSKNNLYVAGSFYNTLNCNTKKVVSSGDQDLFVAIFSENGLLKQLISAGGAGSDIASCLCVTADDHLVIGGILSDSAMFEKTKAPGYGRRLFVAAMNNRGKSIWINTISFSQDASLFMIGADKNGNIFASGVFTGTLEVEDQIVTSNGKKDIFLIRLGKTGSIDNLYSFGSEEDDYPSSLSVSADGNVVLSGAFGKTFEKDGTKFSSSNNAKTKAFIVSFTSDFKIQWANTFLGDDFVQVASMKHDLEGNFYATGSFSSQIKISDTLLVSKGYTDAFLLKYKPDGTLDWGRGFGSWYYDYATHLNIDNLGGAIITGSLGGAVALDSLLIEPVLNDNSAMVIQFSSEGEAIWADCIRGTGRNFSNGSTIDGKGNLYFTGSFRNKFEKGNDAITSFGDQDIFLAKYYNCLLQKAEITGHDSFCPGSGTELSIKHGFTNIVWNDTITDKLSIIANKPGEYWVSMLDKKGCLLTDTILIKQNQLPLFSLGNDTTLLVTDSLILHASYKYTNNLWLDYSTGEEFLAKPEDMKPGVQDYWLTVSNSFSCIYSDTISVTWLQNYDWVDLAKINVFTYPNPAEDRVFWYVNTDEPCQLNVEFADGNGRVLYRQFFKQYLPGEVKEINLGNMPSGIYSLRISSSPSATNFKTVRVIKK